MTRGQSLLLRLLVAGLASLLALASLEILLRVRPVHGRFRESAIVTPRLSPPGQPEFRLPMDRLDKPPGAFRIVAVGDSYTFGDGVYPEDAYPQRLAARLREAHTRFEVVSWARRGWNTAQQLQSISRHLEVLDPDLLLIGFTLNDTEPTAPAERESLRAKVVPRSPPTRLGRWMAARSTLLKSLWTSFENIRVRRELARYYSTLHSDRARFTECRKALKGFKRIARQRGIPLLVVVFPIFDSQLDHRYRYRDAHRNIVERLEELGIRSLDLLPYYQGLDGRRLAVTPFTDPHPNELGHRIAADAILRRLWKQHLIPRDPLTDS